MTDDVKRHIQLSWEILEHKYRYYVLIKPIIGDTEYDMLEKEYEALCDKLKLPGYASNMVEFDMNRASCKLVANKLQPVKKKYRRRKKVK